MSQPGIALNADAVERLNNSHNVRTRYKRAIYSFALAIVLAFSLVLLFGIVYPPPALPTLPDWGKSIVDRMNTAVPVLLTLFGLLASLLGINEARGASDVSKVDK